MSLVLRREFFVAITPILVARSLVGQQAFTGKSLVQSPIPLPTASSLVSLPLDQMPASPPEVQFHQGQLTIKASNSTLGDILRAVCRETGASIDVTGDATERVVGRFGPGPAPDVLVSLLNGSHFNYVLLGSAQNPFALSRIVMTSRSVINDQSFQQASAPTPQNQPDEAKATPVGGMPPAIRAANARAMAARALMTQQPLHTDDMSSDDYAPSASDRSDAEKKPETPGQDDRQQRPNRFGPPGAVKTPEQLSQELQQRQQQIQQ